MTVAELIRHLQDLPGTAPIAIVYAADDAHHGEAEEDLAAVRLVRYPRTDAHAQHVELIGDMTVEVYTEEWLVGGDEYVSVDEVMR